MKNIISFIAAIVALPIAVIASKMNCRHISEQIADNLFGNPIMKWIDNKATKLEDYFDGTEEV